MEQARPTESSPSFSAMPGPVDGLLDAELRALAFSAPVHRQFESLSGEVSAAQFALLRKALDSYLLLAERHEKTRLKKALPPFDLDKAKDLGRRAALLLDRSESLSPVMKRLALGAVKYLILQNEGRGDFSGPDGLDDDALVLDKVEARLAASALRPGTAS